MPAKQPSSTPVASLAGSASPPRPVPSPQIAASTQHPRYNAAFSSSRSFPARTMTSADVPVSGSRRSKGTPPDEESPPRLAATLTCSLEWLTGSQSDHLQCHQPSPEYGLTVGSWRFIPGIAVWLRDPFSCIVIFLAK